MMAFSGRNVAFVCGSLSGPELIPALIVRRKKLP
jgi:hypothetical protein